MKRIITMEQKKITFEEGVKKFLENRKVRGLAEKTIKSYDAVFKAVYKYIPYDTDLVTITEEDINKAIVSMRESGLSPNTIQSYTRSLKAFFRYMSEEDICDIRIKLYKGEETVKDTYTDAELRRLLKKPNLKTCNFCEYRNWVIINMLLNSGMRAATLRSILIKDVNIDNKTIVYRHNKNKKIQVVPLCNEMALILREYMRIRNGKEDEVLFPNEFNEPLTENALKLAIKKYNNRRGVSKTSIHLFRHSFAERFIQNGGNPFELQKILGHSTLEMTKHYCRLYDCTLVKKFDSISPLALLTASKGNSIKMRQKKEQA